MLKKNKFHELTEIDPELKRFYKLKENGFYKVNVTETDREELKSRFRTIGFSALNFTDSRSIYQFYNLERLWNDIKIVLNEGITLWHPATEPVSAGEIYKYLTGNEFVNELSGSPADYNYKTIYDMLFDGKNGYICDKITVLNEIGTFIENNYRKNKL